MNDKLKEIRDKYCREGSLVMLNTEVIGEIQSETYQLGRQEVIDEIEILAKKCFPYIALSDEHGFHFTKPPICNFLSKLNNLKK